MDRALDAKNREIPRLDSSGLDTESIRVDIDAILGLDYDQRTARSSMLSTLFEVAIPSNRGLVEERVDSLCQFGTLLDMVYVVDQR